MKKQAGWFIVMGGGGEEEGGGQWYCTIKPWIVGIKQSKTHNALTSEIGWNNASNDAENDAAQRPQ